MAESIHRTEPQALNFSNQRVNKNVNRMYVCSSRYNFEKYNLFVLSLSF